ncbi:MAG TPA: hypothetical protein VGY90_03970 [Steroidobacteraceae bacterium]|jgi:hypothetical protein|nr:hypothetical protein [Steroidobacteraceae bacterium]HEV3181950.1 hypothetical protein [Steroidobacteraceae bacterium]
MTQPPDAEGRKVSSLRELPQAIEPARDLWPHIEARLSQIRAGATAANARAPLPASQRAARRGWLAAAAMVACVAVGVWIGRSLLPGAVYGSADGAASTTGASALDAVYVSDPRYARQRAALLRSLPAHLAALPPPARAKVTASLAALRKAKYDLESELGKDPGNALLQELLVNTYQDEMRVLTDVRDASDAGRGI